jgi:hypothetical protein
MVHACSGAPPHFLVAVRAFLNKVFPEQWIGRGGPTAWPARCSDLNPLYYYLWERLKPTVNVTEVSDVQDWQQRIQNGLGMVRTTPGIFQPVRKSLFGNTTSCVEAQGGHFEQFL